MSNDHVLGQESSVDAQAETDDAVTDGPELRPTVELESQATVDTTHPDAHPEGMTLEGQETHLAREQEITRTRQRADSRQQSSREARTRQAASTGSAERRREFQERAASVAPSQAPTDPREQCSQADLAAVNEQAQRLAAELEGWSRAAIARRLAARVVDGADISRAVLDVVEGCQREPGTVIPIASVPKVDRATVSIQGEVVQLWEPGHPAIQDVGLLADDSGRVKFTIWTKSDVRPVSEGDQVTMRSLKKNWYQGRCSVAVTGSSLVTVEE